MEGQRRRERKGGGRGNGLLQSRRLQSPTVGPLQAGDAGGQWCGLRRGSLRYKSQPRQEVRQERSLFFTFRPSHRLDDAAHTGKGDLLHSPHSCQGHLQTPAEPHREASSSAELDASPASTAPAVRAAREQAHHPLFQFVQELKTGIRCQDVLTHCRDEQATVFSSWSRCVALCPQEGPEHLWGGWTALLPGVTGPCWVLSEVSSSQNHSGLPTRGCGPQAKTKGRLNHDPFGRVHRLTRLQPRDAFSHTHRCPCGYHILLPLQHSAGAEGSCPSPTSPECPAHAMNPFTSCAAWGLKQESHEAALLC